MKNWNAPAVEELEVKLTAKEEGTTEQYAGGGVGDWSITATYNQDTHEWNDFGGTLGGCLEEKKDS